MRQNGDEAEEASSPFSQTSTKCIASVFGKARCTMHDRDGLPWIVGYHAIQHSHGALAQQYYSDGCVRRFVHSVSGVVLKGSRAVFSS
jgi:hypothetical protein